MVLKFQSYSFADVSAHDWRLTGSSNFTHEQPQETQCIHSCAEVFTEKKIQFFWKYIYSVYL